MKAAYVERRAIVNKLPLVMARLAGLLLLLLLVLVLLKQAGLTRVAHWSWWAVTSPVWGTWVLTLLLAMLGVGWALLTHALRKSVTR